MNIFRFVFLYLSIFPFYAGAQTVNEAQIDNCLDLPEYEYMDFTSFPGVPTTRQLQYGGKTTHLNVQEGYRIRYAWKGIKFLDLKIEYPGEDHFESNLKELIEYYEHLKRSDNIVITTSADSMSYRSFFADRPYVSDRFAFLATDLLVDEHNKRFIYVYYWNPNKDEVLLDSIQDFLREKARSMQGVRLSQEKVALSKTKG